MMEFGKNSNWLGWMRMRCCIVFIFFSSTLFGQEIRPFEDYGQCLTGFVNSYTGDTILPAQFEFIDFLSFRFSEDYDHIHSVGYRVKLNDKYGVLDFKGNYLLEPQYEEILEDFYTNRALVKKNGKYGTVSSDLQPVMPLEFDSIYSGGYDYLSGDTLHYVIKNGKMGLYDLNARCILQPAYDTIEPIIYYFKYTDTRTVLYKCKAGNLEFIYDREGRQVVEKGYEQITPLLGVLEKTPRYYSVKNKWGNYSVVASPDSVVLPWSRYEYSAVSTTDDWKYGKDIHFFRQQNSKKRSFRMVNLETGKHSGWYRSIDFLVNDLWITTNSYSQLLDRNFNPVSRRFAPNDMIQPFTISGMPGYGTTPDFGNLKEIGETDELTKKTLGEPITQQHVYSLCRMFNLGYDYNRHRGVTVKYFFGLVNLTTDELSPVIYDRIYRIGGNGKSYFWAVYGQRDSLNGNTEATADIYDHDGHFLRSICIDQNIQSNLQYVASYSHLDEGFRLLHESPYTGRVDALPYRFYFLDGTQPKVNSFNEKINNYWFFNDSTIYVQTGPGNELHLSNITGKASVKDALFLNKTYSEIYRFTRYDNDKVVLLTTGKTSMFVNEQFEVLLDSCSKVFNYSKAPIRPGDHYLVAVAVRKGKAYGLSKGVFYLLDSTQMNPSISTPYYLDATSRVDKYGNYVDESGIRYFSSTKVSLEKNRLALTNRNTFDTLCIFNGVAEYEQVLFGLVVSMTSGKTGYLDYFSGKWIIEPKFDSLAQFQNGYHYGDVIWFARNKDSKWFAIEKNGKRLSEAVFDRPFSFEYEDGYAFASLNGKVGTVNRKFQWVTKPTYKSSNRLHDKSMLFTENDYVFVARSSGKVFSVEHDSLLIDRYRRIVFFRNGALEIRDDNGNVIQPMKPFAEMLRNENLALTIVPHSGQGYDSTVYDERSLNDSIPVMRRAINQLVFDQMRSHCISKDSMLLAYRNLPWIRRPYREQCEHYLWAYSRKLASEELIGECFEKEYTCTNGIDPIKRTSYFIKNDSLVEIKDLGQIFLPGYEEKLDIILEKAIQQNQLFGLACVNMAESIKELKQHFVVRPDGIGFYLCDKRDELFVSIEIVRELLLPGLL